MLRDETEPFLLLGCEGVKRLQFFDSFRDSLLCCQKWRLLIGSVFDHRDYIRQLFAVNFSRVLCEVASRRSHLREDRA